MQEIVSHLPSGPVWAVLSVIILLVFGAGIFSEESSKKLWLVGRIFRWTSARRERSIARERRIQDTVADDLRRDLKQLRIDLDQEQERGRQRDAQARERERELEQAAAKREREILSRVDDQLGYMEFNTSWARHVILMAAQHGWKPPLPPWFSFAEWQQKHASDQ